MTAHKISSGGKKKAGGSGRKTGKNFLIAACLTGEKAAGRRRPLPPGAGTAKADALAVRAAGPQGGSPDGAAAPLRSAQYPRPAAGGAVQQGEQCSRGSSAAGGESSRGESSRGESSRGGEQQGGEQQGGAVQQGGRCSRGGEQQGGEQQGGSGASDGGESACGAGPAGKAGCAMPSRGKENFGTTERLLGSASWGEAPWGEALGERPLGGGPGERGPSQGAKEGVPVRGEASPRTGARGCVRQGDARAARQERSVTPYLFLRVSSAWSSSSAARASVSVASRSRSTSA